MNSWSKIRRWLHQNVIVCRVKRVLTHECADCVCMCLCVCVVGVVDVGRWRLSTLQEWFGQILLQGRVTPEAISITTGLPLQ